MPSKARGIRTAPEAERTVREGLATIRQAQLRVAHALAEIDESGAYLREGAASVVSYAMQVGFDAYEAVQLTRLGTVFRHAPGLEERVREHRVLPSVAATAWRVLRDTGYQRPGDDWVGWAETDEPAAFRRRVDRRIEETLATEEVVRIEVQVPHRVRDDFSRAQVVASEREGRPLTLGQTFSFVVGDWLEEFDPLQAAEGPRRAGPTAGTPKRYVPREVERLLRRRAHNRCEFPGCRHTRFLEIAHVRIPHRHGGSRELDNLMLLCWTHHRLLDAGFYRFVGTVDDPVFVQWDGREFRRRPANGASSPPADGPPEGALPVAAPPAAEPAPERAATATAPAPRARRKRPGAGGAPKRAPARRTRSSGAKRPPPGSNDGGNRTGEVGGSACVRERSAFEPRNGAGGAAAAWRVTCAGPP